MDDEGDKASEIADPVSVPTDEEHVRRALEQLHKKAVTWDLAVALREVPDVTREALDELRDWCAESGIMPSISDHLLLAFFHSCNRDMAKSKAAMKVYHNTRTAVPEVFSNRSIHGKDVQMAKSLMNWCLLPNKTPEGYRLVLYSMLNPDTTHYVYANALKAQFVTIDSCVCADPTAQGYLFINDMRGQTLTHIWKGGFWLPRKIFPYLQDGMPIRNEGVHFLYSSAVVDQAFRMFKHLVQKEKMSMLHFYRPDDMDSFFKVVPRYCMPADFGGTLPPLEKLQANTDWFLEEMDCLIE